MNVVTDKAKINEVLTRAVEKIYPSKEAFEKELLSGRRLRIYHGVDPTGPHLHLGHLTNLLVLRRLQELGHEIIFLIGDFTARIGDPTDKLSPRQPLSKEEVMANLATFKKQASRIIKFSGENRAQIQFNSKWFTKMKFEEVIEIARHLTVQQMLGRDMFEKRMQEGKPIGFNEFFYPLMQGYDSVALCVDMEIGGTDQTFNMLVGRDLLKIYKGKEKFVITTKLLEDPATGKKLMNKSEGGLVNLDDEPEEMLGKMMALPDAAIGSLAEFSSDLPMEEVEKLRVLAGSKPRDAKLKVAEAIVATVRNKTAGKKAKQAFIKVFSEKQKPEEILVVSVGVPEMPLVDLLVAAQLAPSKSEARRLIEQGAVRINDVKKTDPFEIISISSEVLLQVGPRRFARIRQ